MEDYRTSITLKFKKQSSDPIFLPHQIFDKIPLKYKINYNCSFVSIIHEWFSSPDCLEDYVGGQDSPVLFKSFQLSFDEQGCNEDLLQKIGEEISDWNIQEENLELLSYDFMNKTKQMIEDDVSERHNVFDVKVDVILKTDKTVYESEEWMETLRQLSEPSLMIPTKYSCIRSLRKYLIVKDALEGCSICLENLSAGQKALIMPCSHEFHETCAKKWLQSSHYCPICRFVMPTE